MRVKYLTRLDQLEGLTAAERRRGGPPGLIEAGSSGRRLLQQSPGPVLTVPL